MSAPSSERRGLGPLSGHAILWTIFALVQLPFLGQAFTIDDGNFVDHALQVAAHPTAPYSFEINLLRTREFFEYFANPPGMAYALAPFAALFGPSEVALHSVSLVFPALAMLGCLALARELRVWGLGLALLLLATPAFLVSSHTVMGDIPAAALAIAAVALYVRGLDGKRDTALWLAGLAAAASALFKYSGLAVIPLLFLYAALRRDFSRRALAPIGVAAGIFGIWCALSYWGYGEVHVLAASAIQGDSRDLAERATQLAASLIGVGGATLLPPLLLAWVLSGVARLVGRSAAFAVAAMAALGFGSWLPETGLWSPVYDLGNRLSGGLLLAAGIGAVGFVVASGVDAAREWRKSPGDRASALRLLLVAWFLGFLALQQWLLFTTPKYLVPGVAPLLALLLGAGSGRLSGSQWVRPTILAGTCAATLALALALSAASASESDAHRRFARAGQGGEGEIWFTSHWSIRYYSERAGHRYLPQELVKGEPGPAPGDRVLVVSEALKHSLPQEILPWLSVATRHESFSPVPLRLANLSLEAGYWSHRMGVLPYVWSRRPTATLVTLRLGSAPAKR